MDAEHLYDVTKGCWKVKIPYVSQTEYALAVVDGEVKEVYKIFEWFSTLEERRKTVVFNADIKKAELFLKVK